MLPDDRELQFDNRATGQYMASLTIVSQCTSGPVAFKVKTTAPKDYIVKPNQGVIEPGQSVQVQVTLLSQLSVRELVTINRRRRFRSTGSSFRQHLAAHKR